MAKIYELNGVDIHIYYRDHNPPHIHAIYAEYRAKFRISNGEKIKGFIPQRQSRLVKEWLKDPKVQRWLVDVFNKMNPHLRP